VGKSGKVGEVEEIENIGNIEYPPSVAHLWRKALAHWPLWKLWPIQLAAVWAPKRAAKFNKMSQSGAVKAHRLPCCGRTSSAAVEQQRPASNNNKQAAPNQSLCFKAGSCGPHDYIL